MTNKVSRYLLTLLLVLSVGLSACSGAGDGAPGAPGQYSVQKDSIHFDGDRYELYWADANGSLHRMQTQKLRLVRDPDRTFLEVGQGGDPILHMREDEPITVRGQDHQGAFSSPWFPFLAGAVLGNMLGGRGGGGGGPIIINNPAPGERSTYGPNTPTYRYPPTGSFGRDEQLNGSLDSSKPQTPDYAKVQPSPYATTGKTAGTGGGVAASNKAAGAPGQASGTAAANKGGFASGSQSYANRDPSGSGVGAGSRGVLNGGGANGGTADRPSSGLSGGSRKPSGGLSDSAPKGIGGARAPGGRR